VAAARWEYRFETFYPNKRELNSTAVAASPDRGRCCTAANVWSPTGGGRSDGSPRWVTGTSRTTRFRSTSSATAYAMFKLACADRG
jgi:hypothetical protein